VEALTLRLPTPADPRQEPQLPETLPVEFVSIARACLQPDPRRRATPGELAALLRQSGAEPQKQRPPAVPNAARKPRWAVLVAGVGIALAVIFAGPRLLHRPEPAPKPAAPKQETPQAVPPQTIAPQVVAKTRGEKASAVGAVPQVAKERKSSRGDAAPGVAPGDEVRRTGDQSHAAVRQVLPEITAQARATIRGRVTINVRASVDASGHVTSARLESGNSRYFANLTLEAARQWVFEPTASEWLLRFDITSAGTVVQPSRVAP
jgi:TonB family protein